MASVSPRDFANRLRERAATLRGAARFASEGVLDGMTAIAEKAVERLKERTPRSEHSDVFLEASVGSGDHIADGWTLREGESPGDGRYEVEIVNTNPRALAPIALKGGGEATLLGILEYGSKPHEIVPVNASVLAFPGATGETVFTTHVSHPGTDPYGMVALTRNEVAVDLKKLIDATRRVLGRARANA